MSVAWLPFLLVAAVALALWFRLLPRRSGMLKLLGLCVALASVAGAVAWQRSGQQAKAAAGAVRRELPREGGPAGYVSSNACRACHPSQYDSWYRTFHRTMTQYARPETVKARFDGLAPFPVVGGSIRLERRGDAFWMVPRPDDPQDGTVEELRIGLVTGSHHMQVFWAHQGPGNRMGLLPYAWLLEDQRWVPTVDTFLIDPRTPQYEPGSWNMRCLRCHATAAEPRLQADGSMDSQTGEMGIGCESCHGPGEEHVRANAHPLRRYAIMLAGQGDPTIVNPQRLPPQRSSETCGQCHSVSDIVDPLKFSREGVGFRPGEPLDEYKPPLVPGHPAGAKFLRETLERDPHFVENRFWPDGVVRVIGREWSAMMVSACHTQGGMTCLSCHSMHDSDPNDQLARGADGDEACLKCHEPMRADIAAHTRHAPSSEGSRCYNCHMPHTSYGLLKATRSHFIESPKVATTVATGRPNACNLCHLDRPLGWTAEHLGRWYGQPAVDLPDDERAIASAVLLALRGDAAQRALVAWAMGWKPAQGASGTEWLAGYLTLAMRDPYSAIRYVAARSLRSVPGFEELDYDYVAPEDQLWRSVRDIVEKWRRVRRPIADAEKRARLLLLPDGGLENEAVTSQLARRDNRSMEISE
jgi:predicted CXXCH cytochrome family protein